MDGLFARRSRPPLAPLINFARLLLNPLLLLFDQICDLARQHKEKRQDAWRRTTLRIGGVVGAQSTAGDTAIIGQSNDLATSACGTYEKCEHARFMSGSQPK